jgi:hypothetical protein
MNMFRSKTKLLLLLFFGISMGFLESIVVVYLRMLYYPNGFKIHMYGLPASVIHIEMFREIMTIVMLIIISVLTGEDKVRRFYYFIYLFGIWDIFYYVGLKVILNWPNSFFQWDILFLVPTPWMGPVLAPVIVSASLILYGVIMIMSEAKTMHVIQIISGLLGGAIIFMTFVFAIPYVRYSWYIFAMGEALILFSLFEGVKKSIL